MMHVYITDTQRSETFEACFLEDILSLNTRLNHVTCRPDSDLRHRVYHIPVFQGQKQLYTQKLFTCTIKWGYIQRVEGQLQLDG